MHIPSALSQHSHMFTDIMADVSVHMVSFNDKGQGFPGLVSMYHYDSSVDKMCLWWIFKGVLTVGFI